MGESTLSCYNCRRPLDAEDFRAGVAIQIGSLAACENCAEGLLNRLTPQQRRAILEKAERDAAPEGEGEGAAEGFEDVAPPEEPPERARPGHATTSHLRARTPAPPDPGAPAGDTVTAPRKPLWIGLAVGGGVVLLGLVAIGILSLSGGSSVPAPTPGDPARKAGSPADPKRAEAARGALEKARAFEKAKPDDLAVVVRLYEKAVREAEGTPLAAEARRALDAAESRRRATTASDIAALEKEIRALADAQDYPKAVERLGTARAQRDAPEWGQAVERLTRELRDAMDGAFVRLTSRMVDAYRLGDSAGMKKGRDEVARWGTPRYVEELDKALAENRAQVIRDALVGWWKLDETSGTKAADASGSRYAGQVKGKPAWVPGKIGGGLKIDGDSDYVELPSNGPLDGIQGGGFTVTAWYMPSEVPSRKSPDGNAYHAILIKSGCHLGLSYNNGQGFQFDVWLDKDAKAGVWIWDKRYEPGRFHHVAGVVDPSEGKTRLYVNGALAGSATWKPNTPLRRYQRTPWRIGIANPADQDWRWPARGVIDDVRLYRRAFSDEEILMIQEGRDQPVER